MKMKSTKKTLIMSVLSLLLCCSMLIGTTFAWFTDSVESGINKIQAGNLDIELYYGKEEKPATNKVTDTTDDLFTDEAGKAVLWEPGVVAYTNLNVVNAGSLALKYQFAINFTNENYIIQNNAKLSQVLKVAFVEGGVTGTREEILNKAKTSGVLLTDLVKSGNLEAGKNQVYGVVIYWEPSDLDNNWNVFNGRTTSDGNALHIDLGVNLIATQLANENDSFGKDYDNISFTKPVGEDGGLTLNTDGEAPVTVVLPDGAMDVIRADGVKEVQLVHTLPVVDATNGTVTFESLELMDEKGNIIDLAALGNTAPITVTLPVALADGTEVVVYHDGAAIAVTKVADGKITYKTTHFCKVEVKTNDGIVEDGVIEVEGSDKVQMQIGSHLYTVSKQFAADWKVVGGIAEKIEANIYIPEDLLAYSQAHKNGDLTMDSGVHSDLTLKADLDFAGINWEPIGRFFTNLHGNEYTISNLNNSLFGCVYDCQIDNLTLENVTASGSAAGVVSKELAGDIYISNLTIAGKNTVTYVADSADNWPEGGTGVGAICGVSLIGCGAGADVDITVTGTIDVIYNGVVFSNTTNLTILGVSNELGVNLYKENKGVNIVVADGGAINVSGESFTQIADGVQLSADGKTYYISNAAGYAWVDAQSDDFFAGKTVKLTASIDFGGETIKSIRFWNPENKTTFDGQGNSLSNFVISNDGNAGLFNGTLDVKNLIVENATVTGKYVGVIAGNMYGNIDNCTVKNSVVNGTYWQTGALAGQYNAGNVTNCVVDNCTINGKSAVGGLIGILNENAGERKIENCVVKNTDIIQTGSFGGVYDEMFGVVTGYVNINNSKVYINNCTFEGNTLKGADSNTLCGLVNDSTVVYVNGATMVHDADELTAALNADNTNIVFGADITGNVTVTQKTGVNVVIDGNNYKFNGIMTVFGNGSQSGAETLTIKNINFVAAEGAGSCIVSPDRDVNNKYSYAHNVTVENCTFTDPDGVVNCAAVRHEDGGDKNWTVKNCTVDSTMHSILQVNNVAAKLVVEGCKVYSKNGANLNCCTDVEIINCEFDVTGYAVRFGVGSGGNLGEAKSFVIKDSTLKSQCDDGDAIIMFRASAVDAVLTLTNTTLTGTTEFSGTTSATTITKN